MTAQFYDTDMSLRPCARGGQCVGVETETNGRPCVRCRKCGALHGYCRVADTDATKQTTKPAKPRGRQRR